MYNSAFENDIEGLNELLVESSDEEIFIESLFDQEDIFEEKATQLEYNIRRFKEKYKFDPKTSTIEVDGKRYTVDININQKMLHLNVGNGEDAQPVSTPRYTGADIGSSKNPKIILDKKFFELKDDSRRAAILQHEIGHSKLHSEVPGYKYTDTSKISKEMIVNEIETYCNKMGEQYKKSNMFSDSEIKEIVNTTKEMMKENINSEYLKCSTATELQSKIRADARKAANKVLPKRVPDGIDPSHINAREIEADRYAANRTSEKSLKRGLRDYYKHSRKGYAETNKLQDKANYLNSKEIPLEQRKTTKVTKPEAAQATKDMTFGMVPSEKEAKKTFNKTGTFDYNVRSKALKDKDLRNNSALK